VSNPVTVDRWQFTLTVMVHYVFPIITMGLSLFIVWLETVSFFGGKERRLPALRKTPEERTAYHHAAHFWAKIFAVNFAFGVVTGIPLEFQFGTNWAAFSNFSGGVIGQTLAMEGVFAFFAESVFIGIFLWGEGRIAPRFHWLAALMVWLGSWISGFFIIATNAWMQHPVAYRLQGGRAQLDSFWGLLTNPWIGWQYAHNMSGAVISGAFLLAAGGAFYMLLGRHLDFARICATVGVVGALIFTTLQIYPTGDRHAQDVANYQPSSFAAAEGLFRTQKGAPLVIIGNPDTTLARRFSWAELLLVLGLAYPTYAVRDAMFTNFGDQPWRLVFPVLSLGALGAQFAFQRAGRWGRAFFASCSFIVAMLSTVAAGLYPNILPAREGHPFGLTIHNAASSHHALAVGLRWWSLGIVLAIAYFIMAYRFLFRQDPRPETW
jgi:cytochrome d ubiquinol oxidase subunit I